MHIKPPDDLGLAQLIPTVWWKYATKVSYAFHPEVNNPLCSRRTKCQITVYICSGSSQFMSDGGEMMDRSSKGVS